jgi:hypothetical protein
MKNKTLIRATIGVAAMLAALWGGAYGMHLVGNAWQSFPLFLTSVFGFVGGVVMVATADF